MSAPTATFTDGAGSIAATLEANGLYKDVSPLTQSPRVRLGFSDAGTGTFVVRGRLRGLTSYFYIPLRSLKTNLPLDPSGFTPATGEAVEIDVAGCDRWEIYASALSTTATLEEYTYTAPLNSAPIVQNASANASTFSAGITVNGATGANTVSFPDNLADGLNIKEGSNSYLSFVSTNSAERIVASKPVYQRGGNAPVVKLTASTITTAGAGTYTAAHILGGLILRDPNGAGRTDTTQTAAQIVAALPGAAVDDVIDVMIVNTADAAETITLAGGSGVTLVPATITIAQNEVFIGKLRITNVTGASEAATLYGGNVAG